MNIARPISGFSPDQLINKLAQARAQFRALINGLPAAGWLGPRAEHLNPPLWEAGHIAWFQERWCLRAQPDGSFAPSLLAGADALYDSSTVPHDSRWDLPLLEPAAVDDYAGQVTDAVSARLRGAFNPELAYYVELSLVHELMHIEAWRMAFQNLAYAHPDPRAADSNSISKVKQGGDERAPARGTPMGTPPLRGDPFAATKTVHLARPGASEKANAVSPMKWDWNELPMPADRLSLLESEVTLGSGPDEGFIFDNEKWRHGVTVPAFDIDANLVSETDFAAFVDAGGYLRSAEWTEAGWAWRTANDATHPVYWRLADGAWQVRRFADWAPLSPHAPMLHVNRFEAEACAAWMERRLPTAEQWLRATQHARFNWGAGWEWMRNAFAPYPGFSADPYQDYSQPWFHSHIELRGGGPFTDPVLKRPGFRNFYLPHRRDPFAGFRTVGLAAC